MEADEGKKVTIRFICRYEDDTIYDYAERDQLEFIIGEGYTIPSLEKGVIGMHPGDFRTIRITAAELAEYPFELDEAPTGPGYAAGMAGDGYADEPGAGQDDEIVFQNDLPVKPVGQAPEPGADLFFEVEMIDVEDTEVELGEP
ncbi:FKBP-type peptidyl-prolyl cis-trans isomerase [Geobacter sp. SVR]|uniref:FKBP-type peptidyl-prolyl cis-trans isomerase n=1 Tax=Geobacter sp. SVR TaxID=2495594 RepID=UPI00143EF6B3|nr:FKBP-type peptidyl-prolyl cis-trans isomerase [Geobacter sp. SVR]BCS56054.1 hypothetical protein GSVR_43620 [Geobacter sp. SVR]GCF84817.1 hypothetical protein GSbR_14170 [Geobacter sp. SVR]